ncbi:telomere repeats-binding bouquet formation protein 1 [Eudromia elegans]
MENQKVQKTQCDVKTDLNLLLECLKYQMDCPMSQKEALITIYSICQQNSEASEYLREIGGLMFINDLAKSSIHCIVKEAALFTLGNIIESNVYCQQTLCTPALFEDLISFLMNKDSGVNLKRMSVYVILVLVSNNKNGQTYVRETGCIGLLLQLFRTALSISEINLSDENINQCYQLWSSVCSTLCACVNNPQNEDNQKICCSIFSYAKEWLESCIEPEIVRPICSFVGLTVANNSYVQKYFASVRGLDTLAKVLTRLLHDSCESHSSTKLAVVVTKTLDACIANDSNMGVVLAKYHTVSELLKLLPNDTLDTGEKISVILTIGHCTEVCEENQYELLKNNGLPLMIQVLTESQDEELNKAATFVLQNCKQMTEQLSLKINENSLNVNSAEELKADTQRREKTLQDYWKKAKEILHRINSIEKEQDDEVGLFTELQADSVLQSHSINKKTTCGKKQSFQVSKQLFKQPAKMIKNLKQACTSGCTAQGQSFNSKTFSEMLQTCPYLCDCHKVILEAEKRYKKELRKLRFCNSSSYAAYEKILLTPVNKGRLHRDTSTFQRRKENFQSILLTPIRKNETDASNRDEHGNNTGMTEKYNLIPTYERFTLRVILRTASLRCITARAPSASYVTVKRLPAASPTRLRQRGRQGALRRATLPCARRARRGCRGAA